MQSEDHSHNSTDSSSQQNISQENQGFRPYVPSKDRFLRSGLFSNHQTTANDIKNNIMAPITNFWYNPQNDAQPEPLSKRLLWRPAINKHNLFFPDRNTQFDGHMSLADHLQHSNSMLGGQSPFHSEPERSSLVDNSSSPDKLMKLVSQKSNPVAVREEQASGNSPTGFANPSLKLWSSGFSNIGNTCYMNCVLQCLINTPPIYNYFIEGSHLTQQIGRCPLTEEFGEILCNAFLEKSNKKDIIHSLEGLKKTLEKVAPIFEGYSQNDAHEFFILLIEKIHEELNSAPKKTESYSEFKPSKTAVTLQEKAAEWKKYSDDRDQSIITATFGGILLNEIQCKNCGHFSYSFEDSLDIALNLHNPNGKPFLNTSGTIGLYTCLKEFVKEEHLEGYRCEECKRKNYSTKRTRIWKEPRYLVLQFKRFVYDNYGDLNAIKNAVSFPLRDMNLQYFMHQDSNEPRRSYDLYGIVSHYGNLDSGHYITFLYNENLKRWVEYNDSHVGTVKDDDIEELADASEEAYILFYKRNSSYFS